MRHSRQCNAVSISFQSDSGFRQEVVFAADVGHSLRSEKDVNVFNKINGLHSWSAASVPDHLWKQQQAAQEPFAFRSTADKKKGVISTTIRGLLTELKLSHHEFFNPVCNLVVEYMKRLESLRHKQSDERQVQRLHEAKQADDNLRFVCGICNKPGKFEAKSEFCSFRGSGCRLCPECVEREAKTVSCFPKPTDAHHRDPKYWTNEDLRVAEQLEKEWREKVSLWVQATHKHSDEWIKRVITPFNSQVYTKLEQRIRKQARPTKKKQAIQAFVSIVAACIYIQSSSQMWKFRWQEVCNAVKRFKPEQQLQRDTLKKWVTKIRQALDIPTPTLQQRIVGYANRFLRQLAVPGADQAQEDLEIMVQGLKRAVERSQEIKIEFRSGTVTEIDDRVTACILRARVSQDERPLKRRKLEPINNDLFQSHSDRMLATALLYIRLRLSDQRVTIQKLAQLMKVDLQSLQACKAHVILFMDPKLWV